MPPAEPTVVDADVVITGLGPVGQLLANLLGQRGVSVIAVDEAAGPYDLPRAAVIDDEVLRIFQSVGLDEAVLQQAQQQQRVTYRTMGGRDIDIMRPVQQPFGQPPLVSIHQPSIERTLVEGMARFPCVQARWEHHVDHIEQRADHALIWVRPVTGGVRTAIRGRWVVACDGGRSAVRSRLQVSFGGSTFRQRWLVVDAEVDRPLTSAPHPHFVGNTDRPIVSLPMSPGRHRWEWMLHPHEDGKPFLAPNQIQALMAPWIGNEVVRVERAVIYTFHARTAARWRVGRVLLAGDAAHLMPPFVGQGFSSGARDAVNLAWKLEALLHGAAPSLIDTYETERRPHVSGMQSLAVRWGAVLQTTNPRVGAVRDALLTGLDRSGLLAVGRDHVKPLPTVRSGAFARRPRRIAPLRNVGSLFPQPRVGRPATTPALLDDVVEADWAVIAADQHVGDLLTPLGVPVYVLGVGLIDTEQTITGWLAKHRSSWVCLRPDRYVFDCGQAADVPRAIHALRTLLGATHAAHPEARAHHPDEVAA